MNPIDEVYNLTSKMLEMWEVDSVIDDTELSSETVRHRKLHSKYLRLQSECHRELSRWKDKLAKLKLEKRRHLMDGVSAEERSADKEKADAFLAQLPRKKDRFNSAEAKDFMDGDFEVRTVAQYIDALENRAACLIEIIRQINNATYQIKNIIEHKKFINGIGG